MYRVWYSTESFADYIVDHTCLSTKSPVKCRLYESDASRPKDFHTVPDHIRRILYLDAPDLIVEKDNEPILSIEVTTEAGTGHNAFQRFSRIAAAAENGVPAFYIYPEGAIIFRKEAPCKWDVINPLIFDALSSVMSVYNIPALLYYFPSDIGAYLEVPCKAPNLREKGLQYDKDVVRYSGCPDSRSKSMKEMFKGVGEIVSEVEKYGVKDGLKRLLGNLTIRKQQQKMAMEFSSKASGKSPDAMSPLSAVRIIPTNMILDYLSQYENAGYQIGELLRGRTESAIYQVNAAFRGDPYPGCLAAIDYMRCREGVTFEDRRYNLILVFGKAVIDESNQTFKVQDEHGSTIKDFFNAVRQCSKYNLLSRRYDELKNYEIPRYMMQVRYGSTYSKAKHIRVYSYFSDAIFFPDGALWRDA